MKLHTLAQSVAILLLGMLASLPARALLINPTCNTGVCVTITTFASDGTQTSQTFLSGAAAVNLDADSPIGGPVSYGPFTISRCSGCTGRARAFVSIGSIDKLVFTDAQIRNTSGAPASMTIEVDSGLLGVSGPGGLYPYAVELSGSFLGTTPTNAANQIQVTAQTTSITSCGDGCFGFTNMIDNPPLDPGETDANGNTNPGKYSLIAPPFSAGGTAVFAPKEQQNIQCSGFGSTGEGDPGSCLPQLSVFVSVSLASLQVARIPGSIGAFHVASRCDPDSSDPALQKGCDIMANFFASLGPKGFKVYEVRLEPSPGGPNIDSRGGVDSSPAAWVTKRGAPDDDDNSTADGNISNTKARLQSSGVGDVRANGLCPATGCTGATTLPVRVYCAGQKIAETPLNLNAKGDGKADLLFSLPCNDPAVLIMDPSGQFWVAAPAIL